MVLSKIKSRVASSKLLFQQNFDRASDESAFSAHYKAIIAALLFLGCAIIVAVPVRSDYWVAQSLLNRGLTTNGTIESADVTTRPGKGSRHVTTVDYRFVGPDGQVYRGNSTYQGDEPKRVATGHSIEIVQRSTPPKYQRLANCASRDGSRSLQRVFHCYPVPPLVRPLALPISEVETAS